MKRIVVLFVLACTASLGRAEPPLPAKTLYAQGQTLFAAGHYREAREHFLAGFELSHKPAFVFNAAECARLLGDRDAARADYERYLQLEPDGKQATLARERLAALAPPPAPPPVSAPPPPAPAPPIAAPAVVAAHVTSEPTVTGTTALAVARPAADSGHKVLWIGVGAGVALVAGAVAVYAATRHDMTCSPPGCVVVH